MPKTAILRMRKPHSKGQADLFNWPGSSVTLAGRRWGKTEIGTKKLHKGALTDPGLYWWVGLTWRSASMKKAWRLLKQLARNTYAAAGLSVPQSTIREVEKEIRLPNGGEIWLRTAERPESIAGEGVKGAVIDEFTLMPERVWTEYVQATLLDYGGWAFFCGVPKGKNWGANLFRTAAGLEGWKQFHFSTYDNPIIDTKAIDTIRANLADMLFRQEYLAEITDDAGAVFRKVAQASTGAEEAEPEPRCPYVMGVDWGKHMDFTVISIFNTRHRRQAFLDRFNQIDYTLQMKRLKVAFERFKPVQIIAEANAMGEPLIDQLKADGFPVIPWTATNATKAAAVEALSLALEREEITLLTDPVQVGELQAFEMERLPSGLMRYRAPGGMHDDTVVATMLAWLGAVDAGTGDAQAGSIPSAIGGGGDW